MVRCHTLHAVVVVAMISFLAEMAASQAGQDCQYNCRWLMASTVQYIEGTTTAAGYCIVSSAEKAECCVVSCADGRKFYGYVTDYYYDSLDACVWSRDGGVVFNGNSLCTLSPSATPTPISPPSATPRPTTVVTPPPVTPAPTTSTSSGQDCQYNCRWLMASTVQYIEATTNSAGYCVASDAERHGCCVVTCSNGSQYFGYVSNEFYDSLTACIWYRNNQIVFNGNSLCSSSVGVTPAPVTPAPTRRRSRSRPPKTLTFYP